MKKYLVLGLLIAGLPAIAAKQNLTRTATSLKSFTVSCGTAATAIVDNAGEVYTSLQCSALGAVAVFVGGSGVTTAEGYPMCTDPTLCGVSTLSLASNNSFCRVASGTQTLRCLAVIE